MPEYVYIDTRLLWLLMLLSTGCVQYLLVGGVKAVMQWTRERNHKPLSPIVLRGEQGFEQRDKDTIVELRKAAKR